MALMCETLEGFVESIENYVDDRPDRVFATGYLGGRFSGKLTHDDEEMSKRLSDFIVPHEYFADTETLEDIEAAHNDLFATTTVPSSLVVTEHEDVRSADEFIGSVRGMAEDVDDPIVVCAYFSPGRNHRRYGNDDNDKPRRFASVHFPEAMMSGPGLRPLKRMALSFAGLLIFERDDLSAEAQAMADGEIDHVELEDRHPDRLDPDEVYETLSSLSPGDRVQINDRKRPLTVTTVEESSFRPYGNVETMFFEAHGNDYRVSLYEDNYSKLETGNDSERITEIEVVEHAEKGRVEAIA